MPSAFSAVKSCPICETATQGCRFRKCGTNVACFGMPDAAFGERRAEFSCHRPVRSKANGKDATVWVKVRQGSPEERVAEAMRRQEVRRVDPVRQVEPAKLAPAVCIGEDPTRLPYGLVGVRLGRGCACPACGSVRGECARVEGLPAEVGTLTLCRVKVDRGTRCIGSDLFAWGIVGATPFAQLLGGVVVGSVQANDMTVWRSYTVMLEAAQKRAEAESLDIVAAQTAEWMPVVLEEKRQVEEAIRQQASQSPPLPAFPGAWWNDHLTPTAHCDYPLLDVAQVAAEEAAFHQEQAAVGDPLRRVLAAYDDAIETLAASDAPKAPGCCVFPRTVRDKETGDLRTVHPACKCNACDRCWTARLMGWLTHSADALAHEVSDGGVPAERWEANRLPFRTGQLYRGVFPVAERAKRIRQIGTSASRRGIRRPGWQAIRINRTHVFIVAEVPFGDANPGPAHLVMDEVLCALGEVPRDLGKGVRLVTFGGRWKKVKRESMFEAVTARANVREQRRIADLLGVEWSEPKTRPGQQMTSLPRHADDTIFHTSRVLAAVADEFCSRIADPDLYLLEGVQITFLPLPKGKAPPCRTPDDEAYSAFDDYPPG